ncbi:MAG: hypothetical protein A3I44_05435 [Candidatus Sungbacteria bacterium RIFCSPLOWO2_02_FULL_51_17]|uniref:Octanoyltransferase n=1 Tax=Candidatus Sungbacteria bacterium RIFCSPHIGHO2_02_FULL_51_29 TaxID=1802273 RepID=A0A1G2KQL5_9BACT|nr:MAG: hypothetical protein A2676_01150 [Candidatus Sungbacteria bacterium RIFCSPHIGHO2_01_FULL_51_22]OHA01653.1 MAG: hypothetical protein A3C16_04355 [Candidatus Sungbacteria bacterium RIFCSPHIGHO2_02_FULL_51_29]OHA06403.1 MAG: hypothetical protein A3B29_05215 [Candidatus Sungbacteria bacterium RIFCSPLOWO2_01_FULL_51_34]OHA10559.1 MAG: hypothetical protein A3I44_05435 [Candidatus Sungbacteria bacterium RIFCSPLOWO2_02_FULL_51_17]
MSQSGAAGRIRGDPHRAWRFIDIGLLPFKRFLTIQDEIWSERVRGLAIDTILFATHPPALSLGARPDEIQLAFLRVSQDELVRQQIHIVKTQRGGSLTLHAPGILGCYVIMKTPGSIVAPLERLAHTVFHTFNIHTTARVAATEPQDAAKYRGAWANGKKIASIGLNNSNGVTRFGINFNVSADPRLLALLHPCGIRERELTTMALEGCSASVADVQHAISASLPHIL